LTRHGKAFSFTRHHTSLKDVLRDRELASLGDSYVNFVYSLALSNMRRKPSGAKVKGSVLAEALRKAGLRDYLPSRMTRHMLADGAESARARALIVYAWLQGLITLEESVTITGRNKDLVEGLSQLLAIIRDRVTFP
jgi:hypothetical protein